MFEFIVGAISGALVSWLGFSLAVVPALRKVSIELKAYRDKYGTLRGGEQ